jgi:hypothetical protein
MFQDVLNLEARIEAQGSAIDLARTRVANGGLPLWKAAPRSLMFSITS